MIAEEEQAARGAALGISSDDAPPGISRPSSARPARLSLRLR